MAKKQNSADPKNRIVLYSGEEKKKFEFFNFSKLDHIWDVGTSYIRLCCDGRFYYFMTIHTSIVEIEIY